MTDHTKIIEANIVDLVDKIPIRTSRLIEALQKCGLINHGDITYIMQSHSTDRDKNREILSFIIKRPAGDYNKFRQALKDVGMNSEDVDKYLPSLDDKEDKGLTSGPTASSVATAGPSGDAPGKLAEEETSGHSGGTVGGTVVDDPEEIRRKRLEVLTASSSSATK